VGGCSGLRELNKENRDAAHAGMMALIDLPNLRELSLNHCPSIWDDSILSHIIESFPRLRHLSVDLRPMPGFETAITPEVLRRLSSLPLESLVLEVLQTLEAGHFLAIGSIPTLKTLALNRGRQPFDERPLAQLREKRPDLIIEVKSSAK